MDGSRMMRDVYHLSDIIAGTFVVRQIVAGLKTQLSFNYRDGGYFESLRCRERR